MTSPDLKLRWRISDVSSTETLRSLLKLLWKGNVFDLPCIKARGMYFEVTGGETEDMFEEEMAKQSKEISAQLRWRVK